MITDEIKKLSLHSIDRLHEMRDEMQEVLIHNKTLFKRLYMYNFKYGRQRPLYEAVEQVWKSF
jgi:hypothetical protein